LPIDLLDRRPDLKSSKLRIKAANAEIGVAVADLYPNLSITGVYGFGSTQSQNIFSSDNIMGDLVGSLTMKLFQGGRLRANIKLQKAETEELIATYSKNILEAIREVEDALKSEDEIGNKIENSERSLESLEMAKNIAKKRYESGIETFKNFLDIEQKYYQSKQNLTLVKQEKWNARISLLLALGGDWFNEGISKKLQCLK
jgi:multidrug efflux system outer membrane protein